MQYLRRLPFYAVIALLVYMPLHIFLSQSLSLLTGGLDVWKVAKDVTLALAATFTICLVFWEKKGSRAFWGLVAFTGVYAGLHLLLWGLNRDIYERSALLGTVMNLRLPVFAILGYGAYLLMPSKFVFSSLIKIILGVSTVVAALGLLQIFLPPDILTHVGYGLDRGARPAFFIDDNPDFPRIMSTLREPNALAAYLLVPIGLLAGLVLRARQSWRRRALVAVLGLHLLAVYLTHSRSGMLATVVVLGLVSVWQYRVACRKFAARWWPALAAVGLIFAASGLALRNQPFVQGFITHSTPDESVDDLDSNDYHWLFFRRGVEGIMQEPLGHGPGTAGLASIQNPAGSFLTENYYVQVGYEVGIVGLAMFIALNVWLYVRLRWHMASSSLVPVLLAAFWGYFLINMLLHIWANEAVAAQWWLLAGIALGVTAKAKKQQG